MNSPYLFLFLLFNLLVLYGNSQKVAPTSPPSRFTTKKYADVHGRRMAYVEVGTGDPIVFIHGNPTSSYLWRNVMPHLEGKGRLIAPDLIGFGDSDKLAPGDPSRYKTEQHANFLFTLLEKLGVKENVTLVIHDWGGFFGLLWAYRNRFNPNAVKAVALMESIVSNMNSTQRIDLAQFLDPIRSSPTGEELILQQNMLIESVIPQNIIRDLTAEEFDEYRRPFLNRGEDRRPILTFPREVPIDGMPRDVAVLVTKASRWMASSSIQKLLISAKPGVLIIGEVLEYVRTWRNLQEISVEGLHYIQEDSPDEIGMGISEWLSKIQ